MTTRQVFQLMVLAVPASAAAAAGTTIETVAAPMGFDELTRPREVLVDIYYGDRKVGDALAVTSPGHLRFRDPAALLSLIPALAPRPELVAALSGDLPSNSALACSQTNSDQCRKLDVEVAGIIYDEERFRVDLAIAPKLLPQARREGDVYLAAPTSAFSVTSVSGLSLAGATGHSTTYNFQNRTIASLGSVRFRSDSSFASKLGLGVDSFVAEVDRPDRRYSAGLFWAPGLDILGQRRIAGVGVGTQFDTRADREELEGTPLLLFLARPSRVEVLVDGRLVGSRVYDAGNTLVDTAGLPEGSYRVTLRIHEPNGAVREEARFFVKNAQVAPLRRPIYRAYAGLLAQTQRGAPISVTDTLYYQVSTARRVSEKLAVDASIVGTQHRAILEGGGWILTGKFRVRAAAIVSTAGDTGGLVQLGFNGRGALNFNFDVRRISSRDGRPLIALPLQVRTFDTALPTAAQIGGSYTQATGIVSCRVGAANLIVTGSLRHDLGHQVDYSIGPAVQWPIVNRGPVQLIFEADAQRTRSVTAAFTGVRLLYSVGHFSALGNSGRRQVSSGDVGGSSSRHVWSVTGQYFREDEDRTQLSIGGGFDRDLDSTTAHAAGTVYSRFGTAQADILRNVGGGNGTLFGLTLQTAVAFAGGSTVIGGRDLEESAIIAGVDGAVTGTTFDVLVDGVPRGRIGGGRTLAVFLHPYRRYKLRLRPTGSSAVDIDLTDRDVTLLPGNVQPLRWRADPYITVFGRAVRGDGTPVADATIQTRRGIGQSDGNGYFQVDAGADELLAFSSAAGPCTVHFGKAKGTGDYASIGKVICK